MIAVQSPEIWHRDDLPFLAEWRCYRRVVEVGVDRAEYASTFLRRWINKEIYLGIDPYEPYDEMPFARESDFIVATQRLAEFGKFARLVKATSCEVAKAIHEDGGKHYWTRPYDLVYIDASHTYESVLRDCKLWWPIVADGGMLAGHDWFDSSGDNAGVQVAVREFAEGAGIDVVYFTWDDNPQSWYVYKGVKPIPGTRTPRS